MATEIRVGSIHQQTGSAEINRFPDSCPICRRAVKPDHIGGMFTTTRQHDTLKKFPDLELVFQCPAGECRALFLAYYKAVPQVTGLEAIHFYHASAPHTIPRIKFQQNVEKLSERFLEVYGQAAAAESYELDEVAGPGYRKALEILVKDFAKAQNPGKEKDIENARLSQCIKEYIDDENTKQCAELAAWLGNDEIHYVRKWQERDIEDLKRLVTLTANWIENTMLTKSYVGEMKPNKDGY